MSNENSMNEFKKVLKSTNEQAEKNRKVKNEDSLYKFMAFSGMLEKNRRMDLNKLRKDNEIPFGVHTFEEFYKD